MALRVRENSIGSEGVREGVRGIGVLNAAVRGWELSVQTAAVEGGGALDAWGPMVVAGQFFSITSRSPLTKRRSVPMVRKPCAVGQRKIYSFPCRSQSLELEPLALRGLQSGAYNSLCRVLE